MRGRHHDNATRRHVRFDGENLGVDLMNNTLVTVEPINDNGLPNLVYMTCEELSDNKVQIYVGFIFAGYYHHADMRGLISQDGMFQAETINIKVLGHSEVDPKDPVTIALTMLDTLGSETYQHLMRGGCYDPLTILVQDDPEGIDDAPSLN